MIKNIVKSELWELLTEEEKNLVLNKATMQSFKKNEILMDMNNSCLGLLYIVSGSIRISILSEEGREATLFRLGENETCVFSASCVIHQIQLETLMMAKEETQVIILDTSIVDYLMDHNMKVKCYFYELTIKRFNEALWVLQDVLFKRFDKRLAQYLLDVYYQTNSKTIYSTQEEIAKDVSSSREVVTRMLKNFMHDNLIEIKRGEIKILDLNKLKKLVEE